MATPTFELLPQLVSCIAALDCNEATKTEITRIFQTYGMDEAVYVLGNMADDYSYMEIAGQAVMILLYENGPKSVTEYVKRLGYQLNHFVKDFLLENADRVDALVAKYRHHEYEADWFMARCYQNLYSLPDRDGINVETPLSTWYRVAADLVHDDFQDSEQAWDFFEETFIEYATGRITPSSPFMFNSAIEDTKEDSVDIIRQLNYERQKKRFPNMELPKPERIRVHARRNRGSKSSCYTFGVLDDNLHINSMDTAVDMITSARGGVGLHLSSIRASEVSGGGLAAGPLARMARLDTGIRYSTQGGKRKGAITFSMREWHFNSMDFIRSTMHKGDHSARISNSTTCLWSSYYFWAQIRKRGKITCLCPNESLELNGLYGLEWHEAYQRLISDPTAAGKWRKDVDAVEMYELCMEAQRNSGKLYMMNGDAVNLKSNHRDLGSIEGPNLCTEVVQRNGDGVISSCTLHSISLDPFARKDKAFSITEPMPEVYDPELFRTKVDFQLLARTSRRVVRLLDRAIDTNCFPVLDENERHHHPDSGNRDGQIGRINAEDRPLAIGVSGFCDLLQLLNIAMTDTVVPRLNLNLHACMYFNHWAESVLLSVRHGRFPNFERTPLAEGKFQFDLWAEEREMLQANEDIYGPCRRDPEWDSPIPPSEWGQQVIDETINGVRVVIEPTWESLSQAMIEHGTRHSLLTALQPTASSSILRRNAERTEAYQGNLISRKTLVGAFPVMNRHMYYALRDIGAWTTKTKEYLLASSGRLTGYGNFLRDYPDKHSIDVTPEFLAKVYRLEVIYATAWEIPMKTMTILDLQRARYVDQASSTNAYLSADIVNRLRAYQLYASEQGMKTIAYYLRQPGAKMAKLTGDPEINRYVERRGILGHNPTKKESPVKGTKSKRTVICTDDICLSCQ